MTALDERRFFHEHRADIRIKAQRADQFHLPLHGLAGIGVAPGAVAGDEQGRVRRLGRAREWKIFHDLGGAGQNHLGHAVVSSHRRAVKDFQVFSFQL